MSIHTNYTGRYKLTVQDRITKRGIRKPKVEKIMVLQVEKYKSGSRLYFCPVSGMDDAQDADPTPYWEDATLNDIQELGLHELLEIK
jgi:hypothetical protein